MNWLELLGNKFDDVKEGLDHCEPEIYNESVGEYSVAAKDNSWEFILSENGYIITIFIYPESAKKLPENLNKDYTLQQVTEILGDPDRSGKRFDDEFIGKQGAWIRYSRENHCLHIQEKFDEEGIKLITLMTPEAVPN